jgi:orotate phosphoribosyltransferase
MIFGKCKKIKGTEIRMGPKEIASLLLDIGCLELSPSNPFSYASGLKGPIYCDNRKLISHPNERSLVVSAFIKKLSDSDWDYDKLAGLATAGIPYASFVAERNNEAMVYVRSKPKAHGKRQQVEGDFTEGESVVLFEDLINQGASLNDALLGVKDSGLIVSGCMAIVHYETPKAEEVFKSWELNFLYLTDFSSICSVALEKGLINEEESLLLKAWKDDPKAWSEKYGN